MRISVEAVLFDLDGTLVDSMSAVVRAWELWAAEHGLTEDDFLGVEGAGRTNADILADLLPEDQILAALRRIAEIEVGERSRVVALPGARELAAELPAGRWAVVTSCERRLAVAQLATVGIDPAVLVAADDVRLGKPNAEPYLRGARELGVDPAGCVVVEDSPIGLAAGRAAGMRTIGVGTSLPPVELADTGLADVIVTGLADVRLLGHGSAIELEIDAVG